MPFPLLAAGASILGGLLGGGGAFRASGGNVGVGIAGAAAGALGGGLLGRAASRRRSRGVRSIGGRRVGVTRRRRSSRGYYPPRGYRRRGGGGAKLRAENERLRNELAEERRMQALIAAVRRA